MAITNGYCTLAEARDQLGLASSDTDEDTPIEKVVEAVSREIDKYTGQFFYDAGSQTRYFTSQDGIHVYTDPIQSVTSVTVDDSNDGTYDVTWATTGSSNRYRLRPVNNALESGAPPYWQLFAINDAFPVTDAAIKIVGTFGWSAVPDAVNQACLIQTARLFVRRAAPFGIVEGQDAGMMSLRKGLDVDVRLLLDAFRRPMIWVA
tara:strand:- start:1209 stop:1823 length:615 start_codon:yes stop_codon:yes gene_type:complete